MRAATGSHWSVRLRLEWCVYALKSPWPCEQQHMNPSQFVQTVRHRLYLCPLQVELVTSLARRGEVLCLVVCVCNFAGLFVSIITWNGSSDCRETVRADGQQLMDHAIKFTRWQHTVLGSTARFAVVEATCYFNPEYTINPRSLKIRENNSVRHVKISSRHVDFGPTWNFALFNNHFPIYNNK